MAFEVRQGPRGPGAFWDGRQLTSAYDPEREAKTWAEGRRLVTGALVFVAGDPFGWASRALEREGFKAVALLPGIAAREWMAEGVLAWAPEEGPLEDFLSRVYDQWGADAVAWEVWPGFERHAAQTVLEWSQRFRDHYRTAQGSLLTLKRFGPQFWRNSIRNLLGWSQPVSLVPGTRPVVIAASGPSLDDGLELLAKHRSRFDLWALPSSFETLVRRGLLPDAGIATDGGFYAREHLHRLAGTEVPLLAALSSAPDPVLEQRRCLFFSQGLPVERGLLESLAKPFPEVPSQGTVAVTAIRMALEATSGPVFVAGLDLAYRDLRGHTSPHTVDRRLSTLHGRLDPEEGLWSQRLFSQATVLRDGERTSPALLTYAGWFRTRARFSREVFRIAPTNLRWPSMSELQWSDAAALWTRAEGRRAIQFSLANNAMTKEEREARVREVVSHWRAKAKTLPSSDPWIVEAAETAAPDALAQDRRALRFGGKASQAAPALREFLEQLLDERIR